jgi:outer membrane protein OmpA-like peptidoglycan-associated protein
LPESNQALDRLVEFLNNNPFLKIELDGYSTRTVKTSTLNAAKAVQKYLIAKDISPARVTARGRGPIKNNDWNGLPSQTLKVEFTFLNDH